MQGIRDKNWTTDRRRLYWGLCLASARTDGTNETYFSRKRIVFFL